MQPGQLILPRVRTSRCPHSFFYNSALRWNSLPHPGYTRQPTKLTSAKPSLAMGKNTGTNLFSIFRVNQSPAPSPAKAKCPLFCVCSLSLEAPAIRDSNPVGEPTSINNKIKIKGKLHSKIIISDFVDFVSVEFDGESPRSKFEQERATRSNRLPNMPQKSPVTKTRPVLRHWCQASRIRGCEMVLNLTGRNRLLRWVAYEVIPADHEHFESLT